MGYVPHETRPLDPAQAAAEPRVHHSSFAKPDAEHLATHTLSKLPVKATPNPDGTHPDWTLDRGSPAAYRLRPRRCVQKPSALRACVQSLRHILRSTNLHDFIEIVYEIMCMISS